MPLTRAEFDRILESAHKRVLSEAEKASQDLLSQYVTGSTGIIFSNAKKGSIIVHRAKADLRAFRYHFRVTALKTLDSLQEKAILEAQIARGQGYKAYFSSIDPGILATEKGQGMLQLLFGGGFSPGMRKLIEKRRAEMGIDLSRNLWNYTGQAEADIWKAVYDGLQQNKNIVQIGNSIKKHLTAAGRANMAFNLRRLIVTETNMAYLNSQQYLTKSTPWIEKVKLYRGPDGDAECPICAQEIGPPGSFVIKDARTANYPSYHPFCKCSYIDVLPTKKEMIDYLKKGKPLINQPSMKVASKIGKAAAKNTQQTIADLVRQELAKIQNKKMTPEAINKTFQKILKKAGISERTRNLLQVSFKQWTEVSTEEGGAMLHALTNEILHGTPKESRSFIYKNFLDWKKTHPAADLAELKKAISIQMEFAKQYYQMTVGDTITLYRQVRSVRVVEDQLQKIFGKSRGAYEYLKEHGPIVLPKGRSPKVVQYINQQIDDFFKAANIDLDAEIKYPLDALSSWSTSPHLGYYGPHEHFSFGDLIAKEEIPVKNIFSSYAINPAVEQEVEEVIVTNADMKEMKMTFREMKELFKQNPGAFQRFQDYLSFYFEHWGEP
jgi:glutaredoxin-related protein